MSSKFYILNFTMNMKYIAIAIVDNEMSQSYQTGSSELSVG